MTPPIQSAAPNPAAESPARVGRDAVLARLLARTAHQDARAFQELYRLTAPSLRTLALRLLRNRERADEVLQEAYVAIWHHAAEYSADRAGPLTWMSAIVRNRCYSLLRVPVREVAASAAADGGYESAADEPVDPDLLPNEHRERAQDAARMQAAFDGLPGYYRQALTLAYVDGYSHSEVAEKLAVPLGTAKSWVRRGLDALRQAFASAQPGGGLRLQG